MSNPKMAELFLIEAEELLQDLENGIVAIEDRFDDDELINTIFRAAHTIKGSAGLSGFPAIVEFTHVMENVLEQVRSRKLSITKDLVSALLGSVDVIKAMIALVAVEKPIIEVAGYVTNKERLQSFLNRSFSTKNKTTAVPKHPASSKADNGPRIYEIRMAFNKDIMERGQDPSMLIAEMEDMGELIEVDADPTGMPPFDRLDPLSLYISWRIVLKTQAPKSAIENVFIFVVDDGTVEISDITQSFKGGVNVSPADKKIGELLVEAGYVTPQDVQAALERQKPVGEILVAEGKVSKERVQKTLERQQEAREAQGRGSIRVDTDKLDKLVNLVGELVTGVSQVNQFALSHLNAAGIAVENDDLMAAVEALDQISRDLQEQVMVVRMVPIEATFTRFKRVVRDLADELKKQIKLELSGTETELDKNVIERLADPLKHLIRNSVDHGIESPEERKAAGKDTTGTVHLSAKQREGNILIEISDDGRGVDKQAVLKKAREKGLIEADKELCDKDIYALLFEPGLSTAKAITDVSGRGVGMDVVRRNIEALRGTVEVFSKAGQGSTFRIRLPLTLAIIEGMNVKVGSEILTIPLLSIVEQIRPKKQEIKTIEGKGEVVDVRGEYLPLVRLHELFKFDTDFTDPCRALVIVMENERRRFGLLVDTVLGQQQAVIKALDTNFRKVDGVSGATILGDGSISLILDPHRIEQMALQ